MPPVLPLPRPRRVEYRPPFGGGAGVRLPGGGRQVARLAPKFDTLRAAIEAERARLLPDAAGVAPENVIVFESVETVETLQRAIERMPGMEFLADWEGDEAPPDDDFAVAGNDPNKPVPQRLYLVLLNQQAITELLSLWQRFRADPDRRFRPTLEPWRSLFRRLRDVRRWGPRDRLLDTGILDYWQMAVQQAQERVVFEAELWCRQSDDLRRQAAARVDQVVQAEGGAIIGQHIVEQIAYHGVLIDAPITAIRPILEAPQTELVLADEIMLFRPSGQAAIPLVELPEAGEPEPPGRPLPTLPPTTAVLDGLPLQNHPLLRDRLDVDDPEDLEATYEARDRQHGTAVTSLIAHGCLDSDEPALERRIYVRPITRPDPADFRQPREERIPFGRLTLDVFHEAVRRLVAFREDAGSPRGGIFIVNVSLGDRRQPFLHRLSPWARMLDWLASEYDLLFVVSAGNSGDDITLNIARDQLNGATPEQRRAATIGAVAAQLRHRRILSPAEAVNVLTIGALHADWCNGWPHVDRWIDLIGEPTLPSPYSRLGFGFRSAIKPEVLVPGGRQLYQPAILQNGNVTTVAIVPGTVAPGLKVASPAAAAGAQPATGTRYDRGTSYAAALATRASARAFTDGEVIGIRVSAKSDAGGFEGTVPYGLAVSLGVGNEIAIPLFDEIQARIQQRIRV